MYGASSIELVSSTERRKLFGECNEKCKDIDKFNLEDPPYIYIIYIWLYDEYDVIVLYMI